MTTDTTSLAPAVSLRGEWRSFFAFLRRPVLPQDSTGIGGRPLAAVLRMLALDVLIMAVLMALAFTATAIGAELPRSTLTELDFGPVVVFTIVFIAPLIEEIAFRGWLSGKPGAFYSVWLILAAVGGSALIASQEVTPILALGQFAVMGIAIGLAIWLRKRAPFGWFARLFPLLFWLSTLAFALIHLTNYDENPSPALLLFTVPQLITGSICGYVRVRYGLWASILLHVLHNGLIMAIVLAALSAGVEFS